MARSRVATKAEVQRTVVEGVERVRDALFKPGASKALERRLKHLDQEYKFWSALFILRKTQTKKQLRETLKGDPVALAAWCEGSTFTVDDLAGLAGYWDLVADAVSGKPMSVDSLPAQVVRFLLRIMIRPTTPRIRRYKYAFEEAFRRQTQAQAKGEEPPTAASLAKELMSAQYDRDSFTTLRAMQRGIGRVKQAHKRCVELGIPSPFLPSDEHMNAR